MAIHKAYVVEAHICISLSDSMTVQSVTRSIEALLGYKVDDFLAGKVSLKSLIHKDDQDIADDLFLTEINRTSGTFNIRLRQANGHIRCVKGHYTKTVKATGNDVILDLLLQDAKSLWQGQGVQFIEANFKAMMDNTDDYIYFKDRNHVFTGASQTLVAITNPSEHWSDLLGLTDYDLFSEEYADIYYRLEKQVFAGIDVAHEIQEILSNDGIKGWVDNRKYPIKKENGEIIGLFGIARDITECKQAEELLRIAAIVFESQEGMIVTDTNNSILRVNRAFTNITGYTAAEAIGQNPRLFSSGRHDKAFYADMWDSINNMGSWEGEIWDRRKNGEIYPVHFIITAVKNERNAVTHYVATLTDSTKTKQLEQQHLAEESAQRDTLVREVHHRIKNNLQGVTGVLRNFAVQRPEFILPMAGAISQVQSIAVIHGLQGRTSLTRVRLCELTSEIAENNKTLWDTPIVVDIPSNWIPCLIAESEAVPIALVLNELISNAIKYGDKIKGVNITIRHGFLPNTVQVTISNIGQLPLDFDFHHQYNKGTGLQLIVSLMPRKGSNLSLEQNNDTVNVRLELASPIIIFEQD